MREHISEVHTLVFEANYDEDLLEKDERRPWSTKQRIRGRHGHLSNVAAFETLSAFNGSSNLKEVFLAHLSKDCNNVELVRKRFAALDGANSSFTVKVVDPTSGIPCAVINSLPAIAE